MQRSILCLAAVVLLLSLAPNLRSESLDLPAKTFDGPPSLMMQRYLRRQTDQALARWKQDYENRKTPEQIAAYQKRVREAFLATLGPMPERTPLNPKVVGTISRKGYSVEKIIFESRPKHYVTGLLFLPDPQKFKSPCPGVLVPCGHSFEAKGYPPYQTMGALLALNGMVALVYDPIDQGERGQYMAEGGWPTRWGIDAHTMLGIGSIPLGRNTASFEVWDGMRAIDFLQSRPEVDKNRIGCTGNSGGGTQTSYLMALDERIRAAAPSCYLMSTDRLLDQRGADDAEQQLFNQLNTGPHEADFVMMRAPSPVLICCATHDFFDVVGAWDTMRHAKRLFTRLGFPERVDIMENDAGHNYDAPQREAVARWMSRWLLNKDQAIVEPQIELLSEKEYTCTPGGKVMSLPGARSVYDLNEDYENEIAKRRQTLWANPDKAGLLKKVRELAGVRPLADLPKPQIDVVASLPRNGYRVETLAVHSEPGIVLPAVLFVPEDAKSSALLYLHDKGKAADAGPGGPIEKLVKTGRTVLAVDLRGNGQTQSTTPGLFGSDYQDGQIAYELGRSIVGMRAEDILVCARYAAERATQTNTPKKPSVDLLAVGNVGIPAIHAAALEPALFGHVTIRQMIPSWATIVHKRMCGASLMGSIIHGTLPYYDLPDLEKMLRPKLTVEQPATDLGLAPLDGK